MSPERRPHKEEEKADQLKFDLFQTEVTDSNLAKTKDPEKVITPESSSNSSKIKDNIKEKRKKPTKNELKHEKKYSPQLWKLEGKGGVHDRMQKRPANDPRIVHPVQVYVEQERNDARKLRQKKYIRGFRLKANPDIVLTDAQFSEYTKRIMSMSEEDRINLMLADAEIYDRRSLARKISNKSR